MGLCEVKEGEEIKLKQSKFLLLIGGLITVLAASLNVWLFFIEDGPPIPIILLGMCGIWGYFGLYGVQTLYCYFKYRASIKRYGWDYLSTHVRPSVVKKYSYFMPGTTVYFTDRFVICRDMFIIEYSRIKQMYKRIGNVGKLATSCLVFVTDDGPDIMLCHGISDKETCEVMQLCFSYNPNIDLGEYVPVRTTMGENAKQIHVELDENRDRIRIGKNMVWMGYFCLAMAVCLAMFLPMVMSGERGVLELILVAALPQAVIGVVLVVLGKRKLRE